MRLFIGTGGWQYFSTKSDRLVEYSKIFDFVEVNSTFYSNPSLKVVRSWRGRVPKDFQFAIKCSRIITHKHMLLPNAESIVEAEYMSRVCRILNSQLLILQTPPDLDITYERMKASKDIIQIFADQRIKVVLEARGKIHEDAKKAMQCMGIIRCVDLTKEDAEPADGLVYSRLFGSAKARYEGFSDDEYLVIEKRLNSSSTKVAYLAFHGIKMYSDALRFKNYHAKKYGDNLS